MKLKPRLAGADDVTISREGPYAVIEFNDRKTVGVRLQIGARLQHMSDLEILDLHNSVDRTRAARVQVAECDMAHQATSPGFSYVSIRMRVVHASPFDRLR